MGWRRRRLARRDRPLRGSTGSTGAHDSSADGSGEGLTDGVDIGLIMSSQAHGAGCLVEAGGGEVAGVVAEGQGHDLGHEDLDHVHPDLLRF